MELEGYLDSMPFLSLTEERRIFIDSSITVQELEKAIDAILNNKSPGIDGLPIEVFKEHRDIT